MAAPEVRLVNDANPSAHLGSMNNMPSAVWVAQLHSFVDVEFEVFHELVDAEAWAVSKIDQVDWAQYKTALEKQGETVPDRETASAAEILASWYGPVDHKEEGDAVTIEYGTGHDVFAIFVRRSVR